MVVENINSLDFLGTCTSKEIGRLAEKIETKGRIVSQRKIHKLVKKFFPDLYEDLALHLYNPYRYYIWGNYIDLEHSLINYVFRFE